MTSQPERYRRQDPTFAQVYFTCGWKHRIFANATSNAQRFVALTQAIITSQIFGVLLLIMLSSVSPLLGFPALITGLYTMATVNNAFDNDINPMVGLLDSHGMSLILSASLMTFFVNYGGEVSFLTMLCLFVACIPFYFDGAMALISIQKQRVLTAATATVEEVPAEEDEFQKQNDDGEKTTMAPSEYIMPQLWQESPDLANRLTSDWKEGAYLYDNTRQITAAATIMGTLALGMSTLTGMSALLVLIRSVSGLLGYFTLGDTPALRLVRSNGVSLAMLLMAMGSILIGSQTSSMAMLMMMVLNLFDVYSAATVETHAEPRERETTESQRQSTPVEQFWLTSWRNNSFNNVSTGNQQNLQILMMFAQIFMLLVCGAEGQLPVMLTTGIAMSLCCGLYTFFGSGPQLAAVDAM